MSINELIEEIDDLLLNSSHIPFTTKVILEEEELGRIIDDLKEAVPREIIEAKRMLAERDNLIEQAKSEAQRIIDQAKIYVNRLTDENTITRQAQENAQEIIEQAKKMSQDIHNESLLYAQDIFTKIEGNLVKALDVVRHSKNEFNG